MAPIARTELLGGDMYLKWRPTNQLSTYAWTAFTVEYIAARDRDGKVWMGTAYSQLIAQVARRWRVAVRADFKELPEGGAGRAMGLSGSLAFLLSEALGWKARSCCSCLPLGTRSNTAR